MIRSLLLVAFLALPGTAPAAEESASSAPTAPVEQTGSKPASETASAADGQPEAAPPPLERYRTPWEALSERLIGTASRAVRFDWRQKTLGLGLLGGPLLELNNFSSAQAGAFVRVPLGVVMGDLAITRVFTWGSQSTDQLALTPYRQAGRPSRFDLDFNVALPLAEGVVTARPGFFPPTELVFSLDAGLRYSFYPGGFGGMGFGDVVKALFSPGLSDQERANLEDERLPGMEVDAARYNLLVGGSLDIYFQSGGFIAPRVMVAVPVLSGLSKSGLGWWWELTLGLGWML
ncbi:MAG: hypothetical protein HY901_06390 [Deltaproteobacteria bacterium]|nr:hypothetical protein [Deltaproteobacteria bacterium]